MMTGAAQSPDHVRVNPPGPSSSAPRSDPDQSELIHNSPQEDVWRMNVLNMLTRLVQIQEEVAKHQVQVVEKLDLLGNQVSQIFKRV